VFAQVISSDLKNLQDQVARIKSDQSGSTGRKNDNVDIIQVDENDYIYMETYNGSATTGSTTMPLCGDG